ncbi:MAG: hypothetical protein LBL93_04570 [Ruminococcus sp.]|jgi:hypothetical protein|nr:hypothetical protein [Ruminococcus sp.]
MKLKINYKNGDLVILGYVLGIRLARCSVIDEEFLVKVLGRQIYPELPKKKKKKYSKSKNKSPDTYSEDMTFESPKSKEKKSKKAKKEKKEKSKKENNASKYLSSAIENLPAILKSIKIKKLILDFTVAKADAYECALAYGKTSAVTYNLLGFAAAHIRMKIKKIDINCLFNSKNADYMASCNINVNLWILLIAIIKIVK